MNLWSFHWTCECSISSIKLLQSWSVFCESGQTLQYHFVFNGIICFFLIQHIWTLSACDRDARIFSPADLAAHRQCLQWRAIHTVVICCWKLFFDTCHTFVFPTKYTGLPTLHVPSQVCQWSKGDYAKCISNGAVGQITAVLPDGGVKVAWKDAKLHMQESGSAKTLVQITQQQYNEACMNYWLHSW